MKYIYSWNETTNMYCIRFATKNEYDTIKSAIDLFEHCKQIHNSIIYDAYQSYNGDIERFIDDEAYYVVQELHKNLQKVESMTKGLINLDTGKYYFYLW